MTSRRFAILIFWLTLALGASFFILPSLGYSVFLSPDETANAVTAHRLAPDYGMSNFPTFHPRSFAYHAGRLAPVGFLGMSLVMSVLTSFLGPWILVLGTPLLALSVVIPLVSFTRKWGRLSQIAVVVSWLTFPTVILYANRGLFANLPVVCLAVWAIWLIWKSEKNTALIAAGFIAGLAFVIRPVEAVWIIPWITYVFVLRFKGKRMKYALRSAVFFLAPCLIICALGALIGHSVYDAWFVSGYQLRDPAPLQHDINGITPAKSWFDTWPFGFHPRNVWFNVKSYLIVYLLPWFLLTIGAVITLLRDKKWRIPLALAAYTIVVLSLIYGEALYQDHIKVNQVALANSFLRYLLPVSVIATVAVARLASWIPTMLPRGGRLIVGILVASIGLFGIWTAFTRDDEGLVQNRMELVRYAQIRKNAQGVIPLDSVVASERSDKIFFPTWHHVVSPLPTKEELHRFLAEGELPLALFLRTLTPQQMEEWRAAGVALEPVLPAGNETLYRATAL
jgi:hypothetical protein